MKTNQPKILIAVGLLLLSSSLIIARYTQLPDFMVGLMVGIGIGLLITSIIKLLKRNSGNISTQYKERNGTQGMPAAGKSILDPSAGLSEEEIALMEGE